MNTATVQFGSVTCLILLICILGCDSPPWSRCIIANESKSEIVVRFYTPHPGTAHPCVYSPDDWKRDAGSCPKGGEQALTRNIEENWFEGRIPPGGAVQIDRYRYPDIEEKQLENFLIDRLDIHGTSGDISWTDRTEVFNHLQKEGGGPFWYIVGKSPRYVYYYK